jgi:hypothetical protein
VSLIEIATEHSSRWVVRFKSRCNQLGKVSLNDFDNAIVYNLQRREYERHNVR